MSASKSKDGKLCLPFWRQERKSLMTCTAPSPNLLSPLWSQCLHAYPSSKPTSSSLRIGSLFYFYVSTGLPPTGAEKKPAHPARVQLWRPTVCWAPGLGDTEVNETDRLHQAQGAYSLFIYLFFYYSCFTLFCQFLLYSKMTQSCIYTHTHSFSYTIFHHGLSQMIGYSSSIQYSRILFIHSKCNSLHLPTPNSSSNPLLPLSPLQPQVCSPCL